MNYYDFIALLAEASYADWNVADYDSSGGWRGAALKLGLSFNDVEAICVDAIGGDGEVRDDLLRALGLGERT